MPKIPLPPAESMQIDSLAEVARGGMGTVELGRVLDGRLQGQILAVKRLHGNISEDPEFVSMFLDEAWMTAALKHPNVAQVVVWGNDDKGMFLAIELVQGVSLSRLIKEAQQNKEAFAERTVAFICSQIAGGLVAAHTLATPDGTPLGLVHRDLTPANVLISFEGVVKIIDFGIAKAEERISHTRTGQLKGKPAYMAPEQQRGATVDHRADIFAFGVLMFEMLAGRRPWTAKGAFDVMMEISNDPHPNLGELRKGLNPEFVAIAHKCLEKKPEDRFQSVAEIKARLEAWLSAKGFSSDDQQSLAHFVLRNSQPQVLWWQEALRGEHSKKKKPTFKELEEKIDEEREKKAKAARKAAAAPPAPRPAAGMPSVNRAPPRMSGTVPMQAYQPGTPSPDSSAPPSSAPISSGQQPISGQPISGQQPITGQPISGQPISSQSPGGPAVNPAMMGLAPSPLADPRQTGNSFGSGNFVAPTPAQVAAAQALAQSGRNFGSGQFIPPSAAQVAAAQAHAQAGGNFGSGQFPPPSSAQVIAAQAQARGSGQFAPPSSAQVAAAQAQVAAAQAAAGTEFTGAGTEFMAISPFHAAAQAAAAPASQRNSAVPPSSMHGPASSVQAHGAASMRGPMPILDATINEPGTIPMAPGLAAANVTAPLPPGLLAAAGIGPKSQPPGTAATVTMAEVADKPKRRRRWPLVLVLLVLLLGGAGAGLWFFGHRIGVDLPALVLGKPAKSR